MNAQNAKNSHDAEVKMLLVCGDGKEKKYANNLLGNIGKANPSITAPNTISESKYKGSITAADNTPNLPIIFFGNGKEAEEQSKGILWMFNNFGMKYGWLGKRCVITAEPKEIALQEQGAFAEYYNSRIAEFNEIMKLNKISLTKVNTVKQQTADLWPPTDDAAEKIGTAVGAVVAAPLLGLIYALAGTVSAIEHGQAFFESKEIWKRQYELLTCEFLLNGFNIFLDNVVNIEKAVRDKKIDLITIVHEKNDAGRAHFLTNLINQSGKYTAFDVTDQFFLDNTMLDARNKVIFLGNTKVAKDNDLGADDAYNTLGMCYKWKPTKCFVSVEPLKKEQKDPFIEYYTKCTKKHEDTANIYEKQFGGEIRKEDVAIGIGGAAIAGAAAAAVAPPIILTAPPVLAAVGVGVAPIWVGGITVAAVAPPSLLAAVGVVTVKKLLDHLKNLSDLTACQYRLLSIEFVENGLDEFMKD